MARESFAAVARRRLYGVGFIGLIVALIALSVAFYNKTFTKVVLVTLKTDHTGNQLIKASDVKERGIIVGHGPQGALRGRGRDRHAGPRAGPRQHHPEQRLGADPAQDPVR